MEMFPRGGGIKGVRHKYSYSDLISVANLLAAWPEFLSGKKERKDVIDFSLRFMDEIILLHLELAGKIYQHGPYHFFRISDPKPRDIHKASVRDRLVHHAIYRILYPYFDRYFIYDSYSCRLEKGTHLAMNRFRQLAWNVSHNNTATAWILKCDIRKFFASIDHNILKNILGRYIQDVDILWLLGRIIDSFNTDGKVCVGLPIGNLTSQLLVNIYMNEFDQFVKRVLKVKNYIRYADDFIILHEDSHYLKDLIGSMSEFLEKELKLTLHPKKLFIKTLDSGMDYLGWVHFSHHRVLRTATKHRMFTKLARNRSEPRRASYLGMLSHGNGYKLRQIIGGNSLSV